MKNKILYFEGAGQENTYIGQIPNCRIRTAFQNNEGNKVYLEICGYEYEGNLIGRVDSCHYITNDKNFDDENYAPAITRNTEIPYTYSGILYLVNRLCHCSFDEIKILKDSSNYKVFSDVPNTHNTQAGYNYGDNYNIEVTSKYKHTEDTANLFNKILNDYNKIQSDSELEKRDLLYSDYNELGFLIDCLRYDGKTVTQTENITKYFKKLGCIIEKEKNNYIAKLK